MKSISRVILCILAWCATITPQTVSYKNSGNETSASLYNYQNNDADYWQKLDAQYNITQLVALCKNDEEKALKIMHWVSSLWKHNGYNEPIKSDPLFILDQVINHQQNFRCVEYAKVTRGCCIAAQMLCRLIYLMTKDCQTRESCAVHVACELYLPELKKWAFIDPQYDIMPTLYGKPLNAVEFLYALHHHKDEIVLKSLNSRFDESHPEQAQLRAQAYAEYFEFIEQYLYYLSTPVNFYDSYRVAQQIMLVPENAVNPVILQNTIPLSDDMTYIQDLAQFYPVL